MTRKTLLLALALALLALPAVGAAVESRAVPCGALVPLAGIVDPAPLVLEPEPAAMPPPQVFDPCALRIRPGAQMTSPAGCTMNWVFRDETGALYIGTAGHCLGATGSTGRVVRLAGVGEIGTSVYTINAGVGSDFGLVKINADKHGLVDPTLCHWGGPSAMAEGSENLGEHVILQYGFGTVYGATQFTRARVFEGNGGASSLSFRGLSAGGDSGSPLMFSDGKAAGVLTHGVGVPPFNIGVGLSYGSRLDVALARAEAAIGRDLTLVTSDEPVQLALGYPFPATP